MFKLIALAVVLGICSAKKDYHSIELPVHSKANHRTIHTPSHRDEQKTFVDVPGGVLPVYMTFQTHSSPLYVKQEHRGTKGSHHKSHSKDEPHILEHEVTKPVIQELKEIINPFRTVVQIIKPVEEKVVTKIHKHEGKGGNYGNDDIYRSHGESGYKGYDDKSDNNNGYHNSGGNVGGIDIYKILKNDNYQGKLGGYGGFSLGIENRYDGYGSGGDYKGGSSGGALGGLKDLLVESSGGNDGKGYELGGMDDEYRQEDYLYKKYMRSRLVYKD